MGYMPVLKRPKHEQFARNYVKHSNASLAYREAYGVNYFKVKSSAWNLLNYHPKVKARVEELRQQMAKRADITEDKILTDYQTALNLAVSKDDPNAIVNAATAQAKLVGLLRERVETGEVGDFDQMENISEVLEAVAAQSGPEAATALAKAFGVELTDNALKANEGLSNDALSIAKPASEAVN